MPDQHRAFFADLPCLVVAAADKGGRIWSTIVEGPDGFVRSPDPRRLTLATTLDPQDPLAGRLRAPAEIGLLGIEPATRRRNRLSGVIAPEDGGLAIRVRQSFGNCPQYIRERRWRRVARREAPVALSGDRLSPAQEAWIGAADTLFIGTGQGGGGGAGAGGAGGGGGASDGFDASHRGGAPGFVEVVDEGRLRIPDYAGNNFFNTIGNLLRNPRVGLLFVDFETGGLLHVTGRAEVDWAPDPARDPDARRFLNIAIDAVIERPAALSLRWADEGSPTRRLVVACKVEEAKGLVSFHLQPQNGAPLAPFRAGQHLPIELEVPGRPGRTRRSYSLSGAPGWPGYRLTVKREARGVASRFLHDEVRVGDEILARDPAGDFVAPGGDGPLVLASAGVGLTPMVAMLHAEESTGRPLWFVHGARDGAHHALRGEVDRLLAARDGVEAIVLYSRPRPEDRLGRDHDAVGRVTAETLLALGAGPDAHYMLCGPAAFLSEVSAGLEAAGTPVSHVHHETFGPAG